MSIFEMILLVVCMPAAIGGTIGLVGGYFILWRSAKYDAGEHK